MRLAQCSSCGIRTMVNWCTLKGKSIGELCADCYERVDHDPAPKNPNGRISGPNHNDPGFDNVVRCLEEDR